MSKTYEIKDLNYEGIKKKIKLSKNQTIMDIDAIPNYTELIL
jgi:hypothetical protein